MRPCLDVLILLQLLCCTKLPGISCSSTQPHVRTQVYKREDRKQHNTVSDFLFTCFCKQRDSCSSAYRPWILFRIFEDWGIVHCKRSLTIPCHWSIWWVCQIFKINSFENSRKVLIYSSKAVITQLIITCNRRTNKHLWLLHHGSIILYLCSVLKELVLLLSAYQLRYLVYFYTRIEIIHRHQRATVAAAYKKDIKEPPRRIQPKLKWTKKSFKQLNYDNYYYYYINQQPSTVWHGSEAAGAPILPTNRNKDTWGARKDCVTNSLGWQNSSLVLLLSGL